MNFKKKIILMFVANHLENFSRFIYMEEHVLKNPLLTDYILGQAASISGYLETDIDDIVSLESVYENSERRHLSEVRTLKEARDICNTDIISALDNECDLTFKNDDDLIMSVCEIEDEKQIEEILNYIRVFGDNYYLLKNIFDSYKHYGCYIDEEKIDYLMASFVKKNGSVVDTWLRHLNAVNPSEKKEIVDAWVNEVIESKRIMKELFYSEDSGLKVVA